MNNIHYKSLSNNSYLFSKRYFILVSLIILLSLELLPGNAAITYFIYYNFAVITLILCTTWFYTFVYLHKHWYSLLVLDFISTGTPYDPIN